MQLPRKMSAQNVMASISRTLGTRSDSKSVATNEVKFAGEESKDKLYEPKHKQKLVRVLTVVAYIISVSLAAIILSLYYVFLWNPSDRLYEIKNFNKINITKSNNKTECFNFTSTPIVGVTSVLRQSGTTSNNVTIGDYGTTDATTSQKPLVIQELENYEMISRNSDTTLSQDSEIDDSTTQNPDQVQIYPAAKSARDILNRK